MRQRRSGFTLIELLVVIAIIAILAAILFPVFARARAKAQQTQCLSNLKQCALSVVMYAIDYDNKMPWWDGPGTYFTEPNYWTATQPYLKNYQVILCPSDSSTIPNPNVNPVHQSYVMNQSFNTLPPVDQSMINHPAQTIMLLEWPAQDSPRMVAGSDVAWVYNNLSLGGTPLLQYTGMTRHQGGMNIGLCDGHAHFYPPSQIPGLNSGTGNMGIWFDYTQ